MRFIFGVLLLIGTGLGHAATLVPKLTNDGDFVWRCYEGTTLSTATTYTSLEDAIPACIDRAQNKPSATFLLRGRLLHAVPHTKILLYHLHLLRFV